MKYKLGYVKNNETRDIPVFEASAIPLPPKILTDISAIPVLDQGQQPACVGHAFATAVMWDYYKKTGKVPLISPRFIYSQAKLMDGNQDEGTSAISAFRGVQKLGGCATVQTVPNDTTLGIVEYLTVAITDPITNEIKQYPIKTEVEIQNPTDAQLQTLLAQYGLVIVAGEVDEVSWMEEDGQGYLKPGNAGGHEFTLWGYDTTVAPSTQYCMRNSWNTTWGTQGNGKLLWSDYQNNIYDAMVITIDMQQPLFAETLKRGSTGPDVVKLQTILGITADGIFGVKTYSAVCAFQKAHGLKTDGVVGPKTMAALESAQPTPTPTPTPVPAPAPTTYPKLLEWCTAAQNYEGWCENPPSRSYLNNNPGNLEFDGQPNAVLESGHNPNRFAHFDSYTDGLQALYNLFLRACTGQSQIYHPTMTLLDFYNVYAPSSDGNDVNAYAENIAQALGVPVTTQISTFVV